MKDENEPTRLDSILEDLKFFNYDLSQFPKDRWSTSLPQTFTTSILQWLSDTAREVHGNRPSSSRRTPLRRKHIAKCLGIKDQGSEMFDNWAKYQGGRAIKPDDLRRVIANAHLKGWIGEHHVIYLFERIHQLEAINLAFGLYLRRLSDRTGKMAKESDYKQLFPDIYRCYQEIDQRIKQRGADIWRSFGDKSLRRPKFGPKKG